MFPKLLFNVDAVQKGQNGNGRQCDNPVIHWRRWSLSWASSGLSHWRSLCFSAWCIYNSYLKSWGLKCLRNRTFWPEFYWSEIPIVTITRKIVYTCVIRRFFYSNNNLSNELIPTSVFYCRQRISYNYTSFCRLIGVYFNGRFLTGCCCVKTISIAKSSRLN